MKKHSHAAPSSTNIQRKGVWKNEERSTHLSQGSQFRRSVCVCVQSMGPKTRRKRVQAERMTSYSHLSVKCTPGTKSLNAIKHLVNTN